jgi:hypothetical protein
MENRVSGADAVPGADADVDEAGLTNRLLRKAVIPMPETYHLDFKT